MPAVRSERLPATDARRTRILDAAERHFAEDGYDATPTARIAESAQVPKGLVFYHFPCKMDLLLALVEERLPVSRRVDLTDVVVPGDAAATLLGLHERLRLDREDSLVGRSILFREASTHPEVTDRLRQLREELVDRVDEVLAGAVGPEVDARLRRGAAGLFTAAMLDRANAARLGLETDIAGAATVLAAALGEHPMPHSADGSVY